MADAVVATIVEQGPQELVLRLNCISDGTGEASVVKIDRSTLKNLAGVEPASLAIRKVRWCMQGFTSVQLKFDHTTDDVAYVLSGNGVDEPNAMPDPASAGGTGDLLLTSIGAGATATYDITLHIIKG